MDCSRTGIRMYGCLSCCCCSCCLGQSGLREDSTRIVGCICGSILGLSVRGGLYKWLSWRRGCYIGSRWSWGMCEGL